MRNSRSKPKMIYFYQKLVFFGKLYNFASGMGLRDDIIGYAEEHGRFTRSELAGHLAICGKGYSPAYQSVILRGLVGSGELVRTGRGAYGRSERSGRRFHCSPDPEAEIWGASLRSAFPFASFCIWNVRDLLPLMHDVQAMRMTVVSCDRAALLAVAEHVSSLTDKLVLREPAWETLSELSYGREVAVVTPLVTRAPVETVGGVPCPTLEKILVDILCEDQYHYLEGSEAYAIYGNALSDYTVNRRTLMAYAARRNRLEEVKELIEQEDL